MTEMLDVIETIKNLALNNTEHYLEDLETDEDIINATVKDYGLPTTVLWLSRKNGTECFPEEMVFVKDSYPYNTWIYYANTKDSIKAFAIELTSVNNDKVHGRFYQLDYKKHVERLKKNALPSKPENMRSLNKILKSEIEYRKSRKPMSIDDFSKRSGGKTR